MDQGILAVGIDNQNAPSFFMEGGAEMHGDSALAYTTFLLSDRYDFRRQFHLLPMRIGELYIDLFILECLLQKSPTLCRLAQVYAHKPAGLRCALSKSSVSDEAVWVYAHKDVVCGIDHAAACVGSGLFRIGRAFVHVGWR